MPKKLVFSFLLSFLLVTACQPKTEETSAGVSQMDTDGAVSLSSEAAMEQPLGAVFLSKNGSFVYNLTYDGGLMSLIETSDMSTPYFEIDGGTTLTMETDYVTSVSKDVDMAGDSVKIGAYEVYQFMDSEAKCSLAVTLIPYAKEVLRTSLKICDGQDGDLGREALKQLLERLVITSK